MPAVFFDVDGTLFDTRADLAATVNHTRRDLGLAEMPVETVITHVGQGARHLLEHAIPEAKVQYEELWEMFRSHYAEHCCETVVPYPNVRRTLDELKDRGWLLGVNTNKPNFAVKLILEKFGMARYFGSAVVAGGDGIPLKPDAQSRRRPAATARRRASPLVARLDGRRQLDRHGGRIKRRHKGRFLHVRLRQAERLQVHREDKSFRRAPEALESRGVIMVKYPLVSFERKKIS